MLVSVVKMATVFKGCATEEQRSVVIFVFLWAERFSAMDIFIKKCFLLTARSVRRVKRFTPGWRKAVHTWVA
jgi:hypothetical protein